jgi:hypothetical protein
MDRVVMEGDKSHEFPRACIRVKRLISRWERPPTDCIAIWAMLCFYKQAISVRGWSDSFWGQTSIQGFPDPQIFAFILRFTMPERRKGIRRFSQTDYCWDLTEFARPRSLKTRGSSTQQLDLSPVTRQEFWGHTKRAPPWSTWFMNMLAACITAQHQKQHYLQSKQARLFTLTVPCSVYSFILRNKRV